MIPMNNVNKLPYRPNVCIIILNKSNEILIGERYGQKGVWQLPQGGIEAGNSEEETVFKESEEELGISKQYLKIIKKLAAINQYEFDTPPDYAKGIWCGQKQTFWLARFSGDSKHIDLNSHKPEFMNYKWVNPKDLLNEVEEKRRAGYSGALKELYELL